MSTAYETTQTPAPVEWSKPRLDDRAFLVVLAAMLLMLLATVGAG